MVESNYRKGLSNVSMVEEKIQARLKGKGRDERRQIAIFLREEQLAQLERIAKAMADHSEQNVTRNMLIDDAIEAYIDEASKTLTQNGLWPDPRRQEEPFDTVVLPAAEDGFREVFLGERRWYYVKLDKKKIDRIRYLALYVKSPVAAVTHYGKVAENGFHLDTDKGKYLIQLAGEPIKLEHSVGLGDTVPMATRSPKYTTLEKLKAAQYYNQL